MIGCLYSNVNARVFDDIDGQLLMLVTNHKTATSKSDTVVHKKVEI